MMTRKICWLVAPIVGTVGLIFAGVSNAGVDYLDPDGGWAYIYNGDAAAPADSAALDGTWDHTGGSDSWDGTGIGVGKPGGASALTDGGTTYLRMQDPGEGAPPDPSNRKLFFIHDITGEGGTSMILDDGVTLSFRARIATSGPLDNYNTGGTWPAGGDGYGIHDGGKSNFTLHQGGNNGGTISFSLALETEDETSFNGPGLAMNSLNGASVAGGVDWQGSEGAVNLLSIPDPTEWHEFWINIISASQTGGSGTHSAFVFVDGATAPVPFDVTAGDGEDAQNSYLGLGLGSTPQHGAIDVDFLAWKPGLHSAVPVPGLACDFDSSGDCDLGDLNAMTARGDLVAGVSAPGDPMDLNDDDTINTADLNEWLAEAGPANGFAGAFKLGDLNLDGRVDAVDFGELGNNWQRGTPAVPPSPDTALVYAFGDVNGDFVVDSLDFSEFGNNWQTVLDPVAAAATSASAVPEPSTVSLLSVLLPMLWLAGRLRN